MTAEEANEAKLAEQRHQLYDIDPDSRSYGVSGCVGGPEPLPTGAAQGE